MDTLFEVTDDNLIKPQAELLAIEPFNKIWNRDKTKNKTVALKEISLIYFLCSKSKNNIYKDYEKEERYKNIINDLFNGKWDEDKVVKEAITLYNQRQPQSKIQLLLDSANGAIDKLRAYFNNIDLTETDNNGRLIYNAKDLMNNVASLGKLIEGYNKLKEQADLELINSSTIRGGGDIGYFE